VTKFLQAAADIWEYSATTNSGELFFKLSMPFIYSDQFYSQHWQWLKEREAMFNQILTPEWFAALRGSAAVPMSSMSWTRSTPSPRPPCSSPAHGISSLPSRR